MLLRNFGLEKASDASATWPQGVMVPLAAGAVIRLGARTEKRPHDASRILTP